MSALSLEERVSRLEKEMEAFKQSLPFARKKSWVEKMAGSFKDDPEFQEILRLGREIRLADRPQVDNGQES